MRLPAISPRRSGEETTKRLKIVLIAAIAAVVTFLHYSTGMQQVYFHIFYRELYFLPLILAGFWFGLRGGVAASLGISVFYSPFVFIHWQGFSPGDFDRILEIILFNIVAAGLGFLSDRRRVEEKKRLEAEQRAKEHAESANRLKTDFLTVMSHELRTPLISIIGYNDLLIDGVAGSLNDEQIDALRKMEKNSKKLLGLINAMLDFSALEAKSVELREVSASGLIEEVKAGTKDLWEESKLDFVWKADASLLFRTDPPKLKAVLRNLVNNAVKFTDEGSITVDAHIRDGGIEISVIDTGIGIAPEDIPVIFEPFRQLENPLTRRHGGTGLGLYVVKRVLDLLGGTIEVESEVGKGSSFKVLISQDPGSGSKRIP